MRSTVTSAALAALLLLGAEGWAAQPAASALELPGQTGSSVPSQPLRDHHRTGGVEQAEEASESPAWYRREAKNFAGVWSRRRDQLSNPEYWPMRLAQRDPSYADPYRSPQRWAPERGRVRAVSFDNRYGARLSAHIWAPPARYVDPATDRRHRGRYPTVIFVNGYGSGEQSYWNYAQDLAEHGYVVMTFDPQGHGSSEVAPDDEYCDPDGAWRDPQELGVREHGDCAGQNNIPPRHLPGYAGTTLNDLVLAGHTGGDSRVKAQAVYRSIEPNQVFGTYDAYYWLSGPRNPWRRLVDLDRVGLVGHSLGAYAATLVANGDHRFRTAVSLDSYASLMHGVRPRVPTLYQQSEQEDVMGPRAAAPPPTALHPTRRDYAEFHGHDVPVMFLVLSSSTHNEFSYSGPEQPVPASAKGQRSSTYFTLAWLDRYLRGRTGARADALQRLTAPRFDDSVDTTSIGTGRWDPVSQQNQPYMIEGTRVRRALSFHYRSNYALRQLDCPNMRRRVC